MHIKIKNTMRATLKNAIGGLQEWPSTLMVSRIHSQVLLALNFFAHDINISLLRMIRK